MEISAAGRNVVITGGSQGLGLATARAYASSGANVAILARRADKLDEAAASLRAGAAGKVLPVVCDVMKVADIQRAFDTITGALGSVDVVINNAGTARTQAFEGISDDTWPAGSDRGRGV